MAATATLITIFLNFGIQLQQKTEKLQWVLSNLVEPKLLTL